MKVSVIVPIYNMEKYLENCIVSLIKQTYLNLEIILVLDGCTDNSYNICKKYEIVDKRIKIYEKENGGVSSTRNLGLDKATGEYVMFVDPDDWMENDAIQLSISKMESCGADVLQFNYKKIYEDISNKENNISINEGFFDKNDCIFSCISELYGKEKLKREFGQIRTVWGKIYKKEKIKDIRFLEDIYIFEDGIFNLFVFSNVEKIYFWDKKLYNYRIQKKSANNRYKADCVEQSNKILRYLKNIISEKRILANEPYDLVVYENFMRTVNQYFCSKDNTQRNFENIKLLKKVANNDLYRESFKSLKYEYFNMKNKILVLLIKMKFFEVFYVLNKLKNMR